MIRAEIPRSLASHRSIEHPAQPGAINDAAMHAKAHDATRALIHHDEHPVCAQHGRLPSKQIETPQTVLRVTEDREPRWPSRARFWLVPNRENAPHDILGDGNREGQRDLLRNPWTPPARIPPLHVDDRGSDFPAWSLGARLRRHLGREELAILPPYQRSMKVQQR